jgi:3-hydroxy-3-methylglutaryl CoA synthase
MTSMGIVSTGTYFPETYITAKQIAEQSGLPECRGSQGPPQ